MAKVSSHLSTAIVQSYDDGSWIIYNLVKQVASTSHKTKEDAINTLVEIELEEHTLLSASKLGNRFPKTFDSFIMDLKFIISLCFSLVVAIPLIIIIIYSISYLLKIVSKTPRSGWSSALKIWAWHFFKRVSALVFIALAFSIFLCLENINTQIDTLNHITVSFWLDFEKK